MKYLLMILFLVPIISKSQVIVDTTFYINNNGDTVKVVTYTKQTTRLRDTAQVLRDLISLKQNALGYTPLRLSDSNVISTKAYRQKSVDSIISIYGSDYRAANFVAGTNYLAPNGSAAALTNFPTLNQNTSGTAAGLSTPLSFANGGAAGSAATSATTGTMTVNMTTRIITITPTNACTFNASGGTAGQIVTFIITTSGVSSFVLTWGTNFRKTGTLATGTTSARFFAVTFIYIDGTIWQELSRTAVQT
jgi:hypothetical protein